MGYRRITPVERELIAAEHARRRCLREIARKLGRSRSSIDREIKRNRTPDGGHSAFHAQERADRMAQSRHSDRKLEKNPYSCSLIEHAVSCYWSPEQISKLLKRLFPAHPVMHISHEPIYPSLSVQGKGTLKKELTRCLRRERTTRKPRTGRNERRGRIPGMISIHERPADVEDRTLPGHWVGYLIMGAGNRTALGTLAERTTRYLLLDRLHGNDTGTITLTTTPLHHGGVEEQ